jgi:hypothetical protein
MTFSTLITAQELRALTASARPVLLDCGFDLAQTTAGAQAHTAGHLPGARYVHLDDDLSGAKTGFNGRHPLPSRDTLAAAAGRWGIAPGVQVVTYDNQGGPYAARAWRVTACMSVPKLVPRPALQPGAEVVDPSKSKTKVSPGQGGWNPALRGRILKVSGPRPRAQTLESENANGPLSLQWPCSAGPQGKPKANHQG